jgi:hypothetical protein
VWNTILSSIFGASPGDRQLPASRAPAASLSPAQEALLIAFVTFVDQNLVHPAASHEKRGVFLKLLPDLLRLAPSELISLVLTKSMVRCLVGIRINKKHTLYSLAGVTLAELGTALTAGGGTMRRAASPSPTLWCSTREPCSTRRPTAAP